MENSEHYLIMENQTIHTSSLSSRYVRSITNNFLATQIFFGVALIASLVMALTGFPIAWFPVGLIVVCETVLLIINIRSINAGKREMKKFEGASYTYSFYSDYFEIHYQLDDKHASEVVYYKQVKNASRTNGVLAIILSNNSVLFLDEQTVTDKTQYNKVLNILKEAIDKNTSVKKKK